MGDLHKYKVTNNVLNNIALKGTVFEGINLSSVGCLTQPELSDVVSWLEANVVVNKANISNNFFIIVRILF